MFKKILLTVLLLSLFLPIAIFLVTYFTGYEIYRDVSYGAGEDNVMDIYLPKKSYTKESNGCVLFIHGGSWSGGDKSEEAFRCRLLASRGYIAATMNYTLWTEETSEEYSVLDVLDEIDAALLKLREFGEELDIKIDKAATSGYSAGAHLSMLYSFSRAESAPMEIVFVSNMAGPADISPRVWGNDMAKRVGRRLTGAELTDEMLDTEETKELLSSVSPITYISEVTPLTIIMHGGRDNVVPIGNAETLIDKLESCNISYEYVFLKNSDHSLIQNPIKHLGYYKLMLEYCEKYL